MEHTLASDADILRKVDEFGAEHSMAPSTFGRLALGDGSLVSNIKSGRSLTLESAQRLVAFMAECHSERWSVNRRKGRRLITKRRPNSID